MDSGLCLRSLGHLLGLIWTTVVTRTLGNQLSEQRLSLVVWIRIRKSRHREPGISFWYVVSFLRVAIDVVISRCMTTLDILRSLEGTSQVRQRKSNLGRANSR